MRRLGLLLAALGLFLLVFAAVPYFDNGPEQAHQASLVQRYEAETKAVGTCVAPKEVSGVLKIPSLKLVQPIVDSVDQAVLDSGVVGAYPGEPGKGNFSLAGHRVTHGEPFRNLPNLGTGDKVIIEWGCETFTYIVTDNFEVPMSDTSVLSNTERPTLTLITCASLLPTDDRTVVVASLA